MQTIDGKKYYFNTNTAEQLLDGKLLMVKNITLILTLL
ncbi:toxin A domain protein [Clostridioides difficile 840]|nr:toxin A domain protein [Clostridioides difficile 840]